MKHLKKLLQKDIMGTGEVKYGPIAKAMNVDFHAVDPGKYSKNDWQQIKTKDGNMRAKFRDIISDFKKEVRVQKQVRGASSVLTAPDRSTLNVLHHCTIL